MYLVIVVVIGSRHRAGRWMSSGGGEKTKLPPLLQLLLLNRVFPFRGREAVRWEFLSKKPRYVSIFSMPEVTHSAWLVKGDTRQRGSRKKLCRSENCSMEEKTTSVAVLGREEEKGYMYLPIIKCLRLFLASTFLRLRVLLLEITDKV